MAISSSRTSGLLFAIYIISDGRLITLQETSNCWGILVLCQKLPLPLIIGPSSTTIQNKFLSSTKIFFTLVYLWCIFKEHTHVYIDAFFHKLKFQGASCNFGLRYLKDKNKNFARPCCSTPKWKPCTFVWGLWIQDNLGVTNKITMSASCNVNFFITFIILWMLVNNWWYL